MPKDSNPTQSRWWPYLTPPEAKTLSSIIARQARTDALRSRLAQQRHLLENRACARLQRANRKKESL